MTPKANLGDYKGLEVGKAEPEVPDDAIQGELDRLREGFASLEPVDREAADGDLVSIDYKGSVDGEPFEGGEGRDQMIELGSGSLVEGFETGLIGAKGGEDREIEVSFPDDYRAEDLAGKQATFAVTVNEVREKNLPELDDEFASEASEFETLDELRDEIRGRIAHALEHRVEDEFREAAVNAAADAATVEIPDEIVKARAADTWERVERQLASRGISPEAYLQMQGKSRDELIADSEPEAERSLRREATLAAVAEAEGIEVSDEDLIAALGPGRGRRRPPEAARTAARERPRPAPARGRAPAQGRRRDRRSREADPGRAGGRRARPSGRPTRSRRAKTREKTSPGNSGLPAPELVVSRRCQQVQGGLPVSATFSRFRLPLLALTALVGLGAALVLARRGNAKKGDEECNGKPADIVVEGSEPSEATSRPRSSSATAVTTRSTATEATTPSAAETASTTSPAERTTTRSSVRATTTISFGRPGNDKLDGGPESTRTAP